MPPKTSKKRTYSKKLEIQDTLKIKFEDQRVEKRFKANEQKLQDFQKINLRTRFNSNVDSECNSHPTNDITKQTLIKNRIGNKNNLLIHFY